MTYYYKRFFHQLFIDKTGEMEYNEERKKKGRNAMQNTPKPYEIYRHFKGNLYQVLVLAKDSENGRDMVVYQGLYEPFTVYVRDLAMFMEPVDRKKYSKEQFPQEMRFEKVSLTKEECGKAEAKRTLAAETPVQNPNVTMVQEQAIRCEEKGRAVHPALMLFLDAEEYEDKLDVLMQIKNELTPEILTPMELSLGMEPGEGSVEERYRDLKGNLLTRQKYERHRL